MWKKVVSWVIILTTITWSAYAIYSITETLENDNYLSFFDATLDEAIIAIHHPNDFEMDQLDVDCNSRNLEVFTSLSSRIKDLKTVFFSKKRSVFIIETHEKWNLGRIRKTFDKGIYSFEVTGPNSFVFGKYMGKFKGNRVLLYYYDLKLILDKKPVLWKVDEQSSYSIVYLGSAHPTTKDVYIKSNRKISYTSEYFKKSKHSLSDDLMLFGNFIPKDTKHYRFYEAKYLKYTDPTFVKSPLAKLIKTGAILVQVNNSAIFIFDLNRDVELSEYLNDFYHLPENNQERNRFKTFPVCSGFNDLNQELENNEIPELSIYSKDGIGFISQDGGALDALLLELELSKSFTTQSEKSALFKEALPRFVSYRELSPNRFLSKSWVGNRMIETRIEPSDFEKSNEDLDAVKNYFTMNPGLPVISFCALSGRGNVIMEVENEIIGYKNGSLKWRIPVDQALEDNPVALITPNKENEFILLPFSEKVDVIDKMGRKQYSIPGKHDLYPIQFIHKNQPLFGLIRPKEIVIYVANTGKVFKRYALSENIKSWKGMQYNGKSCIGIQTESSLYRIDVQSGKKWVYKANSIDFVGFTYQGGCIVRGPKGMLLNDGANSHEIQVPAYWKYSGSSTFGNEMGLLFHDGKTLVWVTSGKVRWKKETNATEISEIIVLDPKSEFIVLRDALENKAFLWDSSGNPKDSEDRPCQRQLQLTSFGANGCSLTTYLNDFIIQFNY